MTESSRVEEALTQARYCALTDEKDCGTGAIVLAAEVLRLRSELSSEREVREQFARDAVELRAKLAEAEKKSVSGWAQASTNFDLWQKEGDARKAAESKLAASVGREEAQRGIIAELEAQVRETDAQNTRLESRCAALAKELDDNRVVLDANRLVGGDLFGLYEKAESRCAELEKQEVAYHDTIHRLEERLSAYTAPAGEKEVEEVLGVADSSANWKRAHPIACNEALVSLARSYRQTRAALVEVTEDRDTWKQEHENLLSVRQSDLSVLDSRTKELDSALSRLSALTAPVDGGGEPLVTPKECECRGEGHSRYCTQYLVMRIHKDEHALRQTRAALDEGIAHASKAFALLGDMKKERDLALSSLKEVSEGYAKECKAHEQTLSRLASAENIKAYGAGLLNDYGGGNVSWWHDYIRAELERSDGHWRDALAAHDAQTGEGKQMNIENMKASWLAAVRNGEADGFSRHFVPDILEALAESQERIASLEGQIAALCKTPCGCKSPAPSAPKRTKFSPCPNCTHRDEVEPECEKCDGRGVIPAPSAPKPEGGRP